MAVTLFSDPTGVNHFDTSVWEQEEKGLPPGTRVAKPLSPEISRGGCPHIQGIRAADVVVYLKALITQ